MTTTSSLPTTTEVVVDGLPTTAEVVFAILNDLDRHDRAAASAHYARLAAACADPEQTFLAMDTVTVDGTTIDLFEVYDAGESLTGIVLSGHHDTATALAAVRAYAEDYLDDIFDDLLGETSRREVFQDASRLHHTHLRVFTFLGEQNWLLTDTPDGHDLPVTVFTPPV
ncbi:hypothetical protein BBK14_13550 [Parafrankia soli]|uniref:Uncharacterized protein n=1 Tax=Parafrankia soli TaxID=2599596 RepID=A0A1S1R1U5_9ACTN|nr:hypothetical protein [Parafrankia soli]OHV39691.1 hypothetical protein BBK14_13550 [Parafrankia soli]